MQSTVNIEKPKKKARRNQREKVSEEKRKKKIAMVEPRGTHRGGGKGTRQMAGCIHRPHRSHPRLMIHGGEVKKKGQAGRRKAILWHANGGKGCAQADFESDNRQQKGGGRACRETLFIPDEKKNKAITNKPQKTMTVPTLYNTVEEKRKTRRNVDRKKMYEAV